MTFSESSNSDVARDLVRVIRDMGHNIVERKSLYRTIIKNLRMAENSLTTEPYKVSSDPVFDDTLKEEIQELRNTLESS